MEISSTYLSFQVAILSLQSKSPLSSRLAAGLLLQAAGRNVPCDPGAWAPILAASYYRAGRVPSWDDPGRPAATS